MSIAQITYLSYFFYILAALFAVLAAVLFFAFDIRRIWKVLRKQTFHSPRSAHSAAIFNAASGGNTADSGIIAASSDAIAAGPGINAVTQKLASQPLEETVPLQGAEDTLLLEHNGLTLLQDITYANTDYADLDARGQ